MSKIDWHAYLDGSLPLETRAEAERILAADPAEKARLENLRAFLLQIASEGQAEQVPTARLHEMLRKSTATKPPFRLWRPVMVTAFVGILVAAIFFRPGQEAVPQGIEQMAASDPIVAEHWIRARTGIDAPMPALASGKLVATERASDAGCYCLVVNGHMVHLSFTDNTAMANGMAAKDGFLVGKGGVGFRAKGLVWFVHGDEEKDVWSVAKEAMSKIQS